jgi:DNA-binding CsgD family transcriptional regulator
VQVPSSRRGVPLVGRSAERDLLDRALDRSRAGAFGCVVLFGEPGCGTSRLARDLVERSSGVTTMAARAHALGDTTPLGLWAEAVERVLRVRPASEVLRLCAGRADALADVLPGVPVIRSSGQGVRSLARTVEALAGVVRALAAEQPVLLVLDDLHLADPSSVSALHRIAHLCADDPVLVVATARAGELRARSDVLEPLLRLEQDGVAQRISVGPLGLDAVRALAEAAVGATGPALVAWLHDRARGIPLDTLDLLDGLAAEGADLSNPTLRRLPAPLADRIMVRLRATGGRAVALAQLLAVLGRPAEMRAVVALSGRPPTELVETVEQLVAAGLAVEDEDGPELMIGLANRLVGDAVFGGMGLARRRQLHREAARVLRTLGRAGEAAEHFARCAGPGEPEAVDAVVDAVRHAEETGAFREALTLLAVLVDLLPAGDRRWLDVVDALRWDAQWVVDHRADSSADLGIPALRAMVAALTDLGDPRSRAAATLRLASFLGWGSGSVVEARAVCADAVDWFERAGDDRGRQLAEHELTWLRGFTDDLVLLEGESRELAGSPDVVVRSRAVRTVGLAALLRGCPEAARVAFEEVGATAGRDPHRLMMSRGGLAVAAAIAGRHDDARGALDDVDPTVSGPVADYRAILGWWSGDLHTVRAATPQIAGAGGGPATRRLGGGLFYAALAALETGADTEADQYATRLRAVYGSSGDDQHGWAMHAALADHIQALLAWRAGNGDAALTQLHRAVAPLLRGDFVIQSSLLLADLAEIAWSTGVVTPDATRELAGIAGRPDTARGFSGLADLAAAWAADTRGEAAADHAAAAAATLTGWPFHRGRALHLLARTSGRDTALELLHEAATTFDRCGASVRRDRAIDELATLGSRGRRAAAALQGPASLTSREREVASLAATGMSARTIAEALFIGERTVEGHLARIYARLGVRTKAELAHRATELGLDTAPSPARTRTPTRTGPAPAGAGDS